MLKNLLLAAALLLVPMAISAKLPEIDANGVHQKLEEIMQAHASHKELTPELVKRALLNYLDILDPTKTYFIEGDVKQWTEPTNELLNTVLDDYSKSQYTVFFDMQDGMKKAIERHRRLEQEIKTAELPKKVNPKEFKDIPWATNEEQLMDRLKKIKALQKEAVEKLEPDLQEKAIQRIAKRQARIEDDILTTDQVKRQQLVYSDVLKATTAALDSHTNYFTPDEAAQFMISVQQRLFGIGAQLRDDINGFTVVKVVEGGPAARGGELKAKDKIIAVNGEPVVGMDIIDAVDLIRGEQDTPVVLTVLRDVDGDDPVEKKMDITVTRGEVVLTETRYEASYEPFGDGIIGYIRLFSFYQDPETSSAADIAREINKLKDNHKLRGLILDLRTNSGGLLSQAVAVAGLFITKGTVVSIKDDTGAVQHLRNLDGKTAFDGPLIILVNRGSASASEIVAQALQDYGRALIIGDEHTYGKGSFQTFTLQAGKNVTVNPEGEYKVTRGSYFTVSGKSPQLVGVQSDVIVPGPYSAMEVGEEFLKYPLENEEIAPNFDDKLLDIPFVQREALMVLYRHNMQQKLTTYDKYLNKLRTNSEIRVLKNKGYQQLLTDINKSDEEYYDDLPDQKNQADFQLQEAYSIMKDLIVLMG